jgi:hypothetical protein
MAIFIEDMGGSFAKIFVISTLSQSGENVRLLFKDIQKINRCNSILA